MSYTVVLLRTGEIPVDERLAYAQGDDVYLWLEGVGSGPMVSFPVTEWPHICSQINAAIANPEPKVSIDDG